MTNDEIAKHIINQFKTDSGRVLGIPAEHQDTLTALLKLAANMAKEEKEEG